MKLRGISTLALAAIAVVTACSDDPQSVDDAGHADAAADANVFDTSPNDAVDAAIAEASADAPKIGDASVACKDFPCPATALGTIRGDTGSDEVVGNGTGNQFFKVHIDEGSKDSAPVSLYAELLFDASSGATYALDFSQNACAAMPATTRTSFTESWPDTANVEDARDYVLQITHLGSACTPWTLKVRRAK